jgi:hypothetical protein
MDSAVEHMASRYMSFRPTGEICSASRAARFLTLFEMTTGSMADCLIFALDKPSESP